MDGDLIHAETVPNTGRDPRSRGRRVAALAAVGLLAVASFEVALALDAPLGYAAWGGAHAHLADGLRVASGVSAAFWLFGALAVLQRGGYQRSPVPFAVSRYAAWLLVGLLSLGTLMNLASSSNWERYLQAPICLTLALLCLGVARGPAESSRPRQARLGDDARPRARL